MLVEMMISFLHLMQGISAVVQTSRELSFLVAGNVLFSDTETSSFSCARFGASNVQGHCRAYKRQFCQSL